MPHKSRPAFRAAIAGFGLALSALAAPAFADDLSGAVAALRAVPSMRADFIQIDANGARVSGVLTLKAPKRLRFQYQPDYPVLMVSDGRALTMIDYQARQVQRWPLHYTPIGLLLEEGRDVAHYARVVPSAEPGVIAILLHDKHHRENGDMTLYFSRKPGVPGGYEITGWDVLDAQNRETRLRLYHQTYGVAVPDSAFTWTDPRKKSK